MSEGLHMYMEFGSEGILIIREFGSSISYSHKIHSSLSNAIILVVVMILAVARTSTGGRHKRLPKRMVCLSLSLFGNQ